MTPVHDDVLCGGRGRVGLRQDGLANTCGSLGLAARLPRVLAGWRPIPADLSGQNMPTCCGVRVKRARNPCDSDETRSMSGSRTNRLGGLMSRLQPSRT